MEKVGEGIEVGYMGVVTRTIHLMFGGGVCFGAMHAPQRSDAALSGMAKSAALLALKEPLSRLVPFKGTPLSKDSDGG